MKFIAPNYWYKRGFLCYLLSPLAGLYRIIIFIRKFLKTPVKFNVPIIVVGNITVGGTGKTPLVIWLADFLQKKGFKPGIVSRGYGGHSNAYPCLINEHSDVKQVGDEALLISKRTHCPMVVAPNRVAAVQKLLATNKCNIIISDDGLQHYALGRDIEIAVIDDFGNGFCLPAGPLREPKKRLQEVDLMINVNLEIDNIYNVKNSALNKAISEFTNVHAVAGIGKPEKFFTMLRRFNLKIIEHPFPDHHIFTPQDLLFTDDIPILMTEKDAVKCLDFADSKYWCVSVQAKINEKDINALQKLTHIIF